MQNNAKITLKIKIGNNEISVEIAKFATVKQLKELLFTKTNVPVESQKIIFKGKKKNPFHSIF